MDLNFCQILDNLPFTWVDLGDGRVVKFTELESIERGLAHGSDAVQTMRTIAFEVKNEGENVHTLLIVVTDFEANAEDCFNEDAVFEVVSEVDLR